MELVLHLHRDHSVIDSAARVQAASGYDFEVVRVRTKDEFSAAINDDDFAFVLGSAGAADFDGIAGHDAARQIRTHAP